MTIETFTRADGVRLAFESLPGRGPVLVFLPGYMSDMTGSKASMIAAWARSQGRAFLRLDYSGCGASDGRFEDGTIDIWRDDILLLIDSVIRGPVALVGSSMGGWLMLLVALALGDRVAGLVGIAAAPDFTDWGFTPDEKVVIEQRGRLEQPSLYGPEPVVTTRAFWRSGQDQRLLDAEIAIACPVRLLHGQADTDVPWTISTQLAARLRSADVQTILVKDGDHRLSRPQDIALLIATIENLLEIS
jgi:pimeloyl-ACP methyl ester carboxylesterase